MTPAERKKAELGRKRYEDAVKKGKELDIATKEVVRMELKKKKRKLVNKRLRKGI